MDLKDLKRTVGRDALAVKRAVLRRCKGPVIVLTQRLLMLLKINYLVSLNFPFIGILKDYFHLL